MKKSLLIFAALFFAVSAVAQSLNGYVPADTMIAGTADGLSILNSKTYNALIYAMTRKTMEDLLKEQGKTLAQAKKECGTAVFFFKIKAFAPQVQFEGGLVARGINKNSFAKLNNITLKAAKDELQKNGFSPEMLNQMGAKFEIIKIAGKNSVLISLPQSALQVCLTGISNDLFQIRFAVGTPVVKQLFSPLKNYSALTKDLRYNSMFSLAANISSLAGLAPEMQQDPVGKSLKNISASIREINEKLVIQAKINTDSPDAAKMIQTQLNALIETLKANPANKTAAEMMKLNLAGNTIHFKAEMPIDFVLTSIATFVMAQQQQQQNTKPAPAPAAK